MDETAELLQQLEDEVFQTMEVPVPNSWWVWPGRVLAGPYPGSMDSKQSREHMRALVDAGIDVVINLQEEDETNGTGQYFLSYRHHLLEFQPNVLYMRLPIRDMTAPTDRALRWTVQEMDRLLANGHNIYVHCWGGHGRSGTIAGAWLIQNGINQKQVFAELARRRSHNEHLRLFECPQTLDQQRILKKFSAE